MFTNELIENERNEGNIELPPHFQLYNSKGKSSVIKLSSQRIGAYKKAKLGIANANKIASCFYFKLVFNLSLVLAANPTPLPPSPPPKKKLHRINYSRRRLTKFFGRVDD